MPGSTYSVSFSGSSQAGQFDAFEVVAATTKIVEVLEIHLSQVSDVGDAQEERLLVLIKSGQTVAGSGGGTPAAIPREIGETSFSGSVATVNPVKASGGEIVTHQATNWNIRGPLDIVFTNRSTIFVPPGGMLTVEIASTPNDPITFSGYILVREIGSTTGPSGLPVQTPDMRAADFLAMHGVNVQITRLDRAYSQYTGGSYGTASWDQCIAHLQALNIGFVRDLAPNLTGARLTARGGAYQPVPISMYRSGYDYWAAAGIKFTFHTGANPEYTGVRDLVSEIAAFETAYPGAVLQVEGGNELNWTYSGRSPNYQNRLGVTYSGNNEMIKRQEDLYFYVKSNTALASKKVVLFENAPNVHAPDGCDSWNKHLYPNQTNPQYDTWTGNFPFYTSPFPTRLREMYTYERSWWSPTKPLQMTEFGWHYIGMNFNYEHTALNAVFTWLMLAKTYEKVIFFELVEGNDPTHTTEDAFGLWSGGNPHTILPTAQYLINFRSAIADPSGTSFSLSNTQFQLNGLPSLGKTLLLQKVSGEYLLVIWREDPYYSGNGTNGAPISVTPVTLSIDVPIGKQVQWISPMDSPTQSVVPSLGKHPLIARIF